MTPSLSPTHAPSIHNSSLPLPSPSPFFSLLNLFRANPHFYISLTQMGNYISCTLSGPKGKHSTGTKVILPTGEIRQLHQPTKAAELMLELDTPNYFLVNSKTLQIGRRFSALNADEDLEMGILYVMFPMKRVNSFVNAADLGSLFIAANSAAKRGSIGNVRISPECTTVDEAPEAASASKLNLDDIEDFSLPEFKHRLSMCRSKKPLLETIAEESAYSR